MSQQGDVIYDDTEKLYMYKYNGQWYSNKWFKQFPCEIKEGCYKAVNRDGDLYLQNESEELEDTICYSNDLQKQYSVNQKGKLVDVIDGELFCLEKFKKLMKIKHRIVVYNVSQSKASTSHQESSQKEKTLTLLPQWRDWAMYYPSVCRMQQYYVVVEHNNQVLDVFDLKGKFVWIIFFRKVNSGKVFISHLME